MGTVKQEALERFRALRKDIEDYDRQKTKNIILEQLANEDVQTLALAYSYAKNIRMHGVDVTKTWESAVQQSAALYEAYNRGRMDSDEEWRKHCRQLGNNVNQFFIDEGVF